MSVLENDVSRREEVDTRLIRLSCHAESYRACAYRARKAIESDRFPEDVLRHIEDDSLATLPTTKLYGKHGPMKDELRDLLAAWYVSRVDEGMGYVSLCGVIELLHALRSSDAGPRGTSVGWHVVDEYERGRGFHLLEELVGSAVPPSVLLRDRRGSGSLLSGTSGSQSM